MMNEIIDFLIQPYKDAPTTLIILEIIAATTGIASVWYARKEHILVFPTGIISTLIYVYLLNIYELRGDMVINAYFFVMSIYGWYNWARPISEANDHIPITKMNAAERWKALAIFVAGVIFVFGAYISFGTTITGVTYIDAFTTAVFFVAMWLMSEKKIEHWTFWILGNIVSVPLYFYKGLGFTAIQYTVFLVLAIMGYIAWRDDFQKQSLARIVKK